MCGIIAAIAHRDIVPILVQGLHRLEYRGYDSAGITVINRDDMLNTIKATGKVSVLENKLGLEPKAGNCGIAHTRWATHGQPSERNAHPHTVNDRVAVVHNGIIENYKEIKKDLQDKSSQFLSETDTEVIAVAINVALEQGKSFKSAFLSTLNRLEGAYALCVLDVENQHFYLAKKGSPLILGFGQNEGEMFVASDTIAVENQIHEYSFLEDGDWAVIKYGEAKIFDVNGKAIERQRHPQQLHYDTVDRGQYRHYMQKEIYEQPAAIENTLSGCLANDHMISSVFGDHAVKVFKSCQRIKILACGTSFHSGLIAKYWYEHYIGIPTEVEIASEFRYRRQAKQADTLYIAISQSGETADTLAAIKSLDPQSSTLGICNVAHSALMRIVDINFLTQAGPEVGVASTKAFTTQLVALSLIMLALGQSRNLAAETRLELIKELKALPAKTADFLEMDLIVYETAKRLQDKTNALFLGRREYFPVALEGALKLKELSYIHAEAYPAGELKHGPLALIDKDLPVITLLPNNDLLAKTKANIAEVSARGAPVIIFAEIGTDIDSEDNVFVIPVPQLGQIQGPVLMTICLQLLAYHTAVLKGTDVDRPRNLAKSVTVE